MQPSKDYTDQLNSLVGEIHTIQSEYEEAVHQLYLEQPPFHKFALRARGRLKNDLIDYCEMVGHCLYAGSDRLLRVWGIEYAKKANVGAASNPEEFLSAFEVMLESEQKEGTANSISYVKLLIEAFSK